MLTLRKAHERGHADHGWLDTHHTFSFSDYYDPEQMGFRALRVLNDDRVAPGRGFGTHSHRDMEILSFVLEGGLHHQDSTGSGGTIRPGQVQRMSAGTGVAHSEKNASLSAPVHFLQIWLLPNEHGLSPSYEELTIPDDPQEGELILLAAPDARSGSITIHSDAELYLARFAAAEVKKHQLTRGYGYIHVARGQVKLGRETLEAGDGAKVEGAPLLTLEGAPGTEVLVFDLS